MGRASRLVAFCLLLAVPCTVRAQITVNTVPIGGVTLSNLIGFSSDGTIGQTFRVADAANERLMSWELALGLGSSVGTMQARIWHWDGATGSLGSLVWESSALSAPAYNRVGEVSAPFLVFTVGVDLLSTAQYLFGVSWTSNAPAPEMRSYFADFDYVNGEAYLAGQRGDQSSTTDWPGALWAQGKDLAFRATFGPATSVPEPSEYVLMAAGIVGLGMVTRRRRRTLAM
ncbi:MAG: PEP-CTERM sorting domain-containing protein [Gemmatimonadota bacterium]|nr:PEP-CTERM sorting domain-containing protein [Gemmatimonadota bacterium]